MDAKKHSATMNAEGLNEGIGGVPMKGSAACRWMEHVGVDDRHGGTK